MQAHRIVSLQCKGTATFQDGAGNCERDYYFTYITNMFFRQIMNKCKDLLIRCATPDAIVRLANTTIKDQAQYIQDVYFKKQEHTSLVKYLERVLRRNDTSSSPLGLLAQVSTHSRMLSENDMTHICTATGIECCYAKLLTLQQFQTEQQFMKQVR